MKYNITNPVALKSSTYISKPEVFTNTIFGLNFTLKAKEDAIENKHIL